MRCCSNRGHHLNHLCESGFSRVFRVGHLFVLFRTLLAQLDVVFSPAGPHQAKAPQLRDRSYNSLSCSTQVLCQLPIGPCRDLVSGCVLRGYSCLHSFHEHRYKDSQNEDSQCGHLEDVHRVVDATWRHLTHVL